MKNNFLTKKNIFCITAIFLFILFILFIKPESYENNHKTILEKVISLCVLIIITNYNVTLGLIIALLIIIRIEYNTRFENFFGANERGKNVSGPVSGPV